MISTGAACWASLLAGHCPACKGAPYSCPTTPPLNSSWLRLVARGMVALGDGALRVAGRGGAGGGAGPGVVLGADGAQRAPDGAAALEAGAEGELPHAVPALDALARLHECPVVPASR